MALTRVVCTAVECVAECTINWSGVLAPASGNRLPHGYLQVDQYLACPTGTALALPLEWTIFNAVAVRVTFSSVPS